KRDAVTAEINAQPVVSLDVIRLNRIADGCIPKHRDAGIKVYANEVARSGTITRIAGATNGIMGGATYQHTGPMVAICGCPARVHPDIVALHCSGHGRCVDDQDAWSQVATDQVTRPTT